MWRKLRVERVRYFQMNYLKNLECSQIYDEICDEIFNLAQFFEMT